MKLFLLNFVKSKTFKAVLALLAAAVTAYATQGCAVLTEVVQSPRVTKFDCQLAALEPIFGEILDLEELLRGVYTGQASVGEALGAAGATEDEIKALVEALQACNGPPPVVPATELTPA